ncbi:MAG: hypothetical protein ABWK00_06425 [Desulfurococcaceae archaeon]
MNGSDLFTWISLVLFLVLLLALFLEFNKRPRRVDFVTRELLRCSRCGFELERDYEAGDLIGSRRGTCPRCGGELVVRGIYAIDRSKLLRGAQV